MICIKEFRKENLLSTEEIAMQFFGDDIERFEEWLNTPFDESQEPRNGLEIQVGCYLSSIKDYGDIVATLSEEDFKKLCTLLTDELYDFHENHIK